MTQKNTDKNPQAHTDESGRLVFPSPPVQRISSSRILLIKNVAIIAAIALTVYDAFVSYHGFILLDLPNQAPLVLALLILIVQLASGAIQQLGMNPFRGVGGSSLMDFLWRWVLVAVYLIDVGSNAIAFGVGEHLTLLALLTRPVDAIAMSLILLSLCCLVTFGDEMMLRLVDRLIVGGRANRVSERKSMIEFRAYQQFLKEYKTRALQQAKSAGKRSRVDFDWLEHGDDDEVAQ